MTQFNTLSGNGTGRTSSTFRPKIVSRRSEQELVYQAALELVAAIDDHLAKGTKHYRAKSGELLRTLDQVVHAILSDNLMLDEDAGWQQDLQRAA